MSNRPPLGIEIDQFRNDLRGRWDDVISAICPELRHAIERGPKVHVTCPWHGGANDFRIHKDFAETGGVICTCAECADGFATIMKSRDCDWYDAAKLILDHFGGVEIKHLAPRYIPSRDPEVIAKEDERKKDFIRRIWDESLELDEEKASPVRRWFANRSLQYVEGPIEDIRCHPRLAYYAKEGEKPTYHPGMVAMIRTAEGKTSTLHRTYLTRTGKKAVLPGNADPRKMCGVPSTSPCSGGAIRLDKQPHVVLQVAEGIESALAARAITRLPTWSTVNKSLMAKLMLPQHVRYLLIWADRDRSGQGETAAKELAHRAHAAGVIVQIIAPPFAIPDGAKGIDWNDVLEAMPLDEARQLDGVQGVVGKLVSAMEAKGDQEWIPAHFKLQEVEA